MRWLRWVGWNKKRLAITVGVCFLLGVIVIARHSASSRVHHAAPPPVTSTTSLPSPSSVAPTGQVPSAPVTTAPAPGGAALTSDTPPGVPAVCERWVGLWADHKGTPAVWLAALKPYSTATMILNEQNVNPADVPAHRVTGLAGQVSGDPGGGEVTVNTDAGPYVCLAVSSGSSFLVDDIEQLGQ